MENKVILEFFAKYIERELGIVYSPSSYFQLQNRLTEIATLMGARDVDDLYKRAQTGITGQFQQLLLDLATNNETSFFRDPQVFRAIEDLVLKPLAEGQTSTDRLRIWSAAASTGQEALSLGILIREFNKKQGFQVPFSIVGTDISDRALERAKAGHYLQLEIQRGLPTSCMMKYFKKNENDRWCASPDLLRAVEYQKLNLTKPFPFQQKFHLVLCRNVLIYHSVEGKTDILRRITAVLAPGGYLVLGSGESLLGLSKDFEQCSAQGAILYRKKAGLSEDDLEVKECLQQTQGF